MISYEYEGNQYIVSPVDINATDNPIAIVKMSKQPSIQHCLGVEGNGWRLVGSYLHTPNLPYGGVVLATIFQCCQTHPDLMGVIVT